MDKDKNTYYVMGHTIDPTIIPDTVEDEDAFVRPVDIDPTAKNLEYEDLYNGYTYIENMKFQATSNSGGGGTGGGVTHEQMTQAIQDALNSIDLVEVNSEDDETEGTSYQLYVNGEKRGAPIDDKYLSDVTTDDENITFTMSNGQPAFTVPLASLENDPIIDLNTF